MCHVAGVKFSSHWEEFVDGLSDEAVALSLISRVGVVARFGGGWRFRGAVLEVWRRVSGCATKRAEGGVGGLLID